MTQRTAPLHTRMLQRAYRDRLQADHALRVAAAELEKAEEARRKAGMGIRAYMRVWTRALRAWLQYTDGEAVT